MRRGLVDLLLVGFEARVRSCSHLEAHQPETADFEGHLRSIVFISLGKHIVLYNHPNTSEYQKVTKLGRYLDMPRASYFDFLVFTMHKDVSTNALQFVKVGTRVRAFTGILLLQLSLKLRRQFTELSYFE